MTLSQNSAIFIMKLSDTSLSGYSSNSLLGIPKGIPSFKMGLKTESAEKHTIKLRFNNKIKIQRFSSANN